MYQGTGECGMAFFDLALAFIAHQLYPVGHKLISKKTQTGPPVEGSENMQRAGNGPFGQLREAQDD